MGNTVINDELIVQKYDNASNALRIMPIDKGVLFIINDEVK